MQLYPKTLLCLALCWAAGGIHAQQTAPSLPTPQLAAYKLSVQLSPYTQHYSPKDPEDRSVFLLGVEREHVNGKLDGAAFFSNTFGQESIYLFPWGGVYKDVGGIPRLSLKWTAGVIYGYKEPYNKKVPYNYKGFSPGLIPAVNYQFSSGWSGQVNILGSAGVMFQINVPLNQ